MNLGNRYSQHSFAQIPSVNMTRSQFDRSFTRKTTFAADWLVPIFCDEMLPGDTVNLSLKTFARLATQVVPLMDNLYLDYFFFFVPNRLVWDNWQRFCGEQTDPGDSTDYTIPNKVIGDNVAQVGSIYDYFGLPTNDTAQGLGQYTLPNVLPFRCYNLIYNEWFRDQNLQDSVVISKADGPDTTTQISLLPRNKKHDYFTSALPWPQKGDAVTLPILVGGEAPVEYDSTANVAGRIRVASSNALFGSTALSSDGTGVLVGAGPTPGFYDPNGSLYADVSTAISDVSINQFRQAIMVQSLLELDARGGTRYTEILMAHFGVTSPDFRLQRPEYLGGGSHRINSHPVPQTSGTSGSNYQANLASFGTGSESGNGIGFTKSFVEHGYVIGLVNFRADVTYQQGMERMWLRQTRYDFFWPKLQQLGEQEIYQGELIWQGGANESENLENIFGYQERYSEYRYKPSQITGEFRSTYATPLDQWHMAQELSVPIGLNTSFIRANMPISRNLAVSNTEAQILWDGWFDYKHARPMLSYSVPATLGRF